MSISMIDNLWLIMKKIEIIELKSYNYLVEECFKD